MRKNVDMKKALITGITGQDGSYLAEFLLEKGYEVYGIVRRKYNHTGEKVRGKIDGITIFEGDLEDYRRMILKGDQVTSKPKTKKDF